MADNEETPAKPASSGDLDFEEEVIEEEYYEEEAVEDDDDEYEDEEIIEEYDEESDEETTDSPKGMTMDESQEGMDDSTAPPPSVTDSTPSDSNSRPTNPDPEGITDFANFPPMSEEIADEESHGPLISGSTTSMSLNDTSASAASQPTSQSVTTIDDKQPYQPILPMADEENQNQPSVQFVPPDREVPTAQPPPIPVSTPPPIEKETGTASPMWYWAVFALVCGLLGGGVYVGWYLVNEDQKGAPDLNEDETRAPTAAPTVGLTTAFDPIQGNCDFQDLRHPHVIDQCNCVGEIQIIADDVRKRYKSRKANFIPTIYEEYDDKITDCSPRNQALLWISSGNEYEFTYQERVERFALATLYASLDGNEWKRNDGWFSEDSICTWEGVVCHDDDGMVQTLDLSNNNLKGNVPPEVGLLESMMQFFAGRNEIDGAIPEALFSLEILQFVDLSDNLITGPIPPAVGSLMELKELNLQGNQLSGRISQQIGNAAALQVLSIGGNQIVGSIPTSFFKLGNLTFLDVGENQLTGSIPTEVGNLQNLTSLTLGPNQFEGDIPSAIGALIKLEYLNIREIPELSGRLPAVYGRNLTDLVDLTITQTKVSGNIEADFGALQKLVNMDLSNNQLRGTLPTQLGNLHSLVVLNLGNNFFEGPIPTTLGTLGNMTQLNLNNNVLTGNVPLQIADLEGLESLQLETNRLTGRVPEDICGLRNANLTTFVVDCSYEENGVQVGLMCEVPSCCTGCRTAFRR